MSISRDMVHLSSEAAFAIDRILRITAWNEAAEVLLGYRKDEVLGTFCGEVLQAKTPEGKVICSPCCGVADGFHHCTPFRNQEVISKRVDGSRVVCGLSTLVAPPGLAADDTLALIFLHPRVAPHEKPESQALRLYCLGIFRVSLGETDLPLASWRRKKSVTLLKYLATHGSRPVHREDLAEVLWPEADPAAGLERLKVVVYYLRRQLDNGCQGAPYLRTEGEYYRLPPDSLWTDVQAFEQHAREGQHLARAAEHDLALARYQSATALYKGPFLQDEPYTDWAMAERERLAEKYLSLLCQVAQLYEERTAYGETIAAYREALNVEPCREDIHRALMRTLCMVGRYDEAILQYRACQRILARELETQPMPETEELYLKMLSRRTP